MVPEESGPCEGARVRHDPTAPRHLSWGCRTPAAQVPSLWLQGRGGRCLLVPPRWAALPAPTVPLHWHLMLDRDVLGTPPHPGPVQEDGGDPKLPWKLQQHHLGSARHTSGETPCCPGRQCDL